MWVDRLTGERLDSLPEVIESGRYLAEEGGSREYQGQLTSKSPLVDDGRELTLVDGRRQAFLLPAKSINQKVELFERILETIDSSVVDEGELVSPLMPESVVNEDSHLNAFERKLLDVIDAGHLHQISMRPRLDLRYEDEVTDVARAKRLSKGALVHLASHSECWQRQTLSGVIPKRVKARFSVDDFNVYENRVYARLLDKVDEHLNRRVGTLRQLQFAVDEALKFYGGGNLHHRLTDEICHLWGKAFTQESTNKASEQLAETLDQLVRALGVIRGLKQSGLYLLVNRSAQVGNGLHLTNILSHDQHYRHLTILWNELKGIARGQHATPDERRAHNEKVNQAYSRYAGLVLRHALTPYLENRSEPEWAGRELRVKQVGLDWQLLLSSAAHGESERVLLEVVPWMGLVSRPEKLASGRPAQSSFERILAWPDLDSERSYSVEKPVDDMWIQLSPFDLYGVERFGSVVDQLLQRELATGYGCPLSKVPTKTLELAKQFSGVEVSVDKHELRLYEALSPGDFSKLDFSLLKENATRLSEQLRARHQELVQLQSCPVCDAFVRVVRQRPAGFIAECSTCRTKRFLRSSSAKREYEQRLDGRIEFKDVGRRSFVLSV